MVIINSKFLETIIYKGFHKESAEDQKLIEYLPESSREHEVIGKWLSLMQEREKGLLPSSNFPANNMSGDLELDNAVASILLIFTLDVPPIVPPFDGNNQ